MPTHIKNFILFFLVLISCVGYTATPLPTNSSPKEDTFKNYLRLADQYTDQVKIQKALTYISLAEDVKNGALDKKYLTKTKLAIAKLNFRVGNLNKAEAKILESIKILQELNDKELLKYAYTLYGAILTKEKEYSLAKAILHKAKLLEKASDTLSMSPYLDVKLGILSLKINEPQKAIEYFNDGFSKINIDDQKYILSQLYLHKANALYNLKKYDKAKVFNDTAIQISIANEYPAIRSQAYLLNSQIFEKQKDFEGSLKNLKIHEKIKDSIFTISKEVIAQEAGLKLKLNQNNVLIEELTAENYQHQETLKYSKIFTILGIALISILSLLTLSLYKNNSIRAKANKLLHSKNNELQIAKENTEKASEARVQFLSTITHELRTPLYAVTGLTHLLLEENPTPNQKEHLNSLKFSGEYLLSLINNILDLNKLEANKVELECTLFNIKKRINDVLVALSKSAKDRNNTLHYEFDEAIPERLKGDPVKISQILINLIGNSIKFTQKGEIWIRVKLGQQKGNIVSLDFEIEDNGVGISKTKQDTIFENFTQGSVQINRKFGGTGLGLSIVKNLLTLMNSTIKLESELHKGSKFLFSIDFEIYDQEVANKSVIKNPINYEYLSTKRVLVVEDNKINQLITRKILEKNQIHCDVADNGYIAINKLTETIYDLILMDIHMPGISGIETTKRIRLFDQQIPIIALTAVTLDDNLDEFYKSGFDDIIPKPFKTEEFFTKINKALVKRSAEV